MKHHAWEFVPWGAHRTKSPTSRGSHTVRVTIVGTLVALVLSTAGCVSPGGFPPSTPTVNTAPAPSAPPQSPGATFSDLINAVGLAGGTVLSSLVVTRSASVDVGVPDGMSRIGVMLACSEPNTAWRAVLGDDGSRWVGGICQEDSRTSGSLELSPSDSGHAQLVITTDRDAAAYVVVYAVS